MASRPDDACQCRACCPYAPVCPGRVTQEDLLCNECRQGPDLHCHVAPRKEVPERHG